MYLVAIYCSYLLCPTKLAVQDGGVVQDVLPKDAFSHSPLQWDLTTPSLEWEKGQPCHSACPKAMTTPSPAPTRDLGHQECSLEEAFQADRNKPGRKQKIRVAELLGPYAHKQGYAPLCCYSLNEGLTDGCPVPKQVA